MEVYPIEMDRTPRENFTPLEPAKMSGWFYILCNDCAKAIICFRLCGWCGKQKRTVIT